MSGVSAEQIILEEGKSPELVAAFQLVAEAECMGEPRYPPQACRDLAKIVACRNYASVLLELCHLVRMGALIGGTGGWESFFWSDGLARARLFRSRIIQAVRRREHLSSQVQATGATVEINYDDGTFAISYGRMPFLAAVLEFLITTLGYDGLIEIFRDIVDGAASRKAVSLGANELSRRLYDYLKDHLPTAQSQRKFRRLIAFLDERAGSDFDTSAIDDPTVLDFWIAESAVGVSDGVDFKTFTSVYRSFVRLRQSLEHAADMMAIDGAMTIGSDREAGEVDPANIRDGLEAVEEDRGPLAVLDEDPAAAVKFLNKRERSDIELLLESGSSALALPLSLLRCEIFGRGQGQITQALRRKAGADEIGKLITECGSETYKERQELLERLSDHVERSILASFHALARCRNHQAIALMIKMRPEVDLAEVAKILQLDAKYADNVVPLRADSVSDRFLILLEDADRVGSELSAMMADARQAFKAISRQGFGETDLDDPAIEEGHAVGAAALLEIRERIAAFLERLGTVVLPRSDWEQQFAADRLVFARQFEILYGGSQ